jgi:hypothetical protein
MRRYCIREVHHDWDDASSTIGIPLASGSCFQLAGVQNLTAFQIIGAGATMDVEYFK